MCFCLTGRQQPKLRDLGLSKQHTLNPLAYGFYSSASPSGAAPWSSASAHHHRNHHRHRHHHHHHGRNYHYGQHHHRGHLYHHHHVVIAIVYIKLATSKAAAKDKAHISQTFLSSGLRLKASLPVIVMTSWGLAPAGSNK